MAILGGAGTGTFRRFAVSDHSILSAGSEKTPLDSLSQPKLAMRVEIAGLEASY
jgi:hypothetical protein